MRKEEGVFRWTPRQKKGVEGLATALSREGEGNYSLHLLFTKGVDGLGGGGGEEFSQIILEKGKKNLH